MITNAAKIKGIKKCKAKNLFSVGLSTLNPPHSHCTIGSPINGTAETKLVITVAPQ